MQSIQCLGKQKLFLYCDQSINQPTTTTLFWKFYSIVWQEILHSIYTCVVHNKNRGFAHTMSIFINGHHPEMWIEIKSNGPRPHHPIWWWYVERSPPMKQQQQKKKNSGQQSSTVFVTNVKANVKRVRIFERNSGSKC